MRRSAPEVVKIAEEAFASLVLDGTLPPEASGALLDGLKGCCCVTRRRLPLICRAMALCLHCHRSSATSEKWW